MEANEWRETQFVILWDGPGESKVVAFGHLLANDAQDGSDAAGTIFDNRSNRKHMQAAR